MSSTQNLTAPSVEDLQRRYEVACSLTQTVDREKITAALQEWCRLVGAPAKTKITFVSTPAEIKNAATASRCTRAPWAATALESSFAVGQTKSSQEAKLVRAGSQAEDAWITMGSAAGKEAMASLKGTVSDDDRPLLAAKAAWAAKEAAWLSIYAIGAAELGDDKQSHIWLPMLEAFEAGCFAIYIAKAEVFFMTIPICGTGK